MSERHKHLAPTQLPEPNVVLHDCIAACNRARRAAARSSSWRCGAASCLPPSRLPGSGRWRPPTLPASAGAPVAAAGSPVAPSTATSSSRSREPAELHGRLALARLVNDDRSPHPRIQLHCVHLSGVPQNISPWECSMEPISWRPGFAPPATPPTRRLLVYFRSGAYRLNRPLLHFLSHLGGRS